MPNLGFTICHLAFFSLGFPEPKGHLILTPPPPGPVLPLSVGPNRAACGATSGKLEGWFYS